MNWFGLLRRLLVAEDLAFSIGAEHIGFVAGRRGTGVSVPAYVAVDAASRRLLAIGDAAVGLCRGGTGNPQLLRVTLRGGLGYPDVAEAFFRQLLRTGTKVNRRAVPPRLIVACPPGVNHGSVKDVFVRAGAREVWLLEAVMAAALGAGLEVENPKLQAVIVLERDWCQFAVISRAQIVASFCVPWGIDSLLEEAAVHALATTGVVLDPDVQHARFLDQGLAGLHGVEVEVRPGPSEIARSPSGAPAKQGLMSIGQPFCYRLEWQHRRALASIDKMREHDLQAAPVHLCGPYATLPGVVDLVGKALHRAVIVPRTPELATLRGAQAVLSMKLGRTQPVRCVQ